MISILDAVRTLTSPERLIELLSPLFTNWLGYAFLFAIVFSETGLLVGFFLPGDSLLFSVGVASGATQYNVYLVAVLLMCAAIIGDNVGYFLGYHAGPPSVSPVVKNHCAANASHNCATTGPSKRK